MSIYFSGYNVARTRMTLLAFEVQEVASGRIYSDSLRYRSDVISGCAAVSRQNFLFTNEAHKRHVLNWLLRGHWLGMNVRAEPVF